LAKVALQLDLQTFSRPIKRKCLHVSRQLMATSSHSVMYLKPVMLNVLGLSKRNYAKSAM